MNPEMIGWLGIIVFLGLLFMGIPIAFVLAFVGFFGYLSISGLAPALKTTGLTFFSSVASYGFSVVPLFLLMGYFAYHSGIISDLYEAAKKWLGHIPGGLAISTIFGGAAFGAVSSSGIASTATLARITIPEMIKGGVDRKLAYGVVASAGPLAQMIPPSVLMIMYAIIAEQPIGELLIAGIIPGILIATLYVLMIYVRVKLQPSLALPQPKEPLKVRISSLRNVWGVFILGVVVIGGIYSGIFTPNEAGAVGAFVALLLLIIMKRLNKDVMKNSILETVKTTSTVFFILGSSFLFGYFLSITRIPMKLSALLTSLPVDPLIIMIGIILMYLILGMFVDMLAAMFITLPIILPAVAAMGYDLIWFGVIMVFLAEVSLVTPPLGLSLFIIKGTLPDSDFKEVIRGSIPFIVLDLIIIALFLAFPEIITFLPSLMAQ